MTRGRALADPVASQKKPSATSFIENDAEWMMHFEQAKLTSVMDELGVIFEAMDADQNGSIEIEEFMQVAKDIISL